MAFVSLYQSASWYLTLEAAGPLTAPAWPVPTRFFAGQSRPKEKRNGTFTL
jgi:hypothetical protein